ncbi:MAG: CooT family nickel-binding protein [Candidatus Odinarchaeota archaeon]|nr:CooT family nickel-binding protein [Candidatus Odinarchaeota archaeon]
MCESDVYIIENGKERVLLNEVSGLKLENNTVWLQNIYGEKKKVEHVKGIMIDFIKHKVLIEVERSSGG